MLDRIADGDRKAARALASRIVAAGEGRVRRVLVIGSRASGGARPDSDLDLVVVVETPLGDGPWSMQRMAAERNRIIRKVGRPPMPTDLWLLSSDHYEEGRTVLGGVEYFAETEGVVVYTEPLQRDPVVRRTPDTVLRQNVRAWLGDALDRLEQAIQASTGSLASGRAEGPAGRVASYASRVIEKSVMALCVLHRIAASTKGPGTRHALTALKVWEPTLAAWIAGQTDVPDLDVVTAHRVLGVVLTHVGKVPGMSGYLTELTTRLSSVPVVLPPGGCR
jgi:predicted nucleotidyltransferase